MHTYVAKESVFLVVTRTCNLPSLRGCMVNLSISRSRHHGLQLTKLLEKEINRMKVRCLLDLLCTTCMCEVSCTWEGNVNVVFEKYCTIYDMPLVMKYFVLGIREIFQRNVSFLRY